MVRRRDRSGREAATDCDIHFQGGGYRRPVTPGGGYRPWLTPEYLRGMIAIGQQSTDLIIARPRCLDGTSAAVARAPTGMTGGSHGTLSSPASRPEGFRSSPSATERLFAGRVPHGALGRTTQRTSPRAVKLGEPGGRGRGGPRLESATSHAAPVEKGSR